MRKVILIFFPACLITLSVALAQTKIKDGTVTNTSSLPNSDAIIELESNQKGLLLPRLSLTSTTSASPLTNFTAGMTIYNTATTGDVTPGYYYSDGSKWYKIGNASDAWNIHGNAGIDPSSNFIGTTDDQPLLFRIYNTSAGGIFRDNSYNTFLGYQTPSNSTANNSTIVGAGSGSATTGVGTTIIGSRNAVNSISGSYNVILGSFSGRNITSGGNNIILGGGVGNSISTASNNIGIGQQALSELNANNNIGIGVQAGQGANGADNIMLGTGAGFQAKGNYSTLIGSSAGSLLTDGQNVMIGFQSGSNASTGIYNTFLGNLSGQYNKGSNNTGLGYYALSSSNVSTSSQNNTSVGAYSGINSTGANNTFLGTSAGYGTGNGQASGSQNTFIGTYAGQDNATGSNNVAIGYNAGVNSSYANNTVLIGYNAKSSDGLSNSTAIGTNSLVTQNNSLVLGSVYNQNSAGSNTNVGIGTTAPNSALQVVGGISTSIKTINSSYTITDADHTIIVVSSTSSNSTITFPTPSASNFGREITVLFNNSSVSISANVNGNTVSSISDLGNSPVAATKFQCGEISPGSGTYTWWRLN